MSQSVEQEIVQAPQPVPMDPSLGVYGDANIQNLPSIELGEAIKEFMPTQTDILNTGVRWNYQANNPHVIWLDKTHVQDYDYSRKGVMRINVQGRVAKILAEREYELPWAVMYKSSRDPKFGVEAIQFFPGMPGIEQEHRNSWSCFGEKFRDCDFDPLASLAQAGIAFTKVCEDPTDGANYTNVYELSSLGKVNVFAAYSLSTGSGGATADFTLYPNITREQACSMLNP
ncbi:hypothetical protein [Acinetobacter sp. GSS19]|uniref:hypothetical protein n=1 Tax=Acinetobacter sp. GSS19 TaxID=3020716 RepID=UPI00235E944A|nr:hypothetical protein [Acinetobacter sp. GSS19]